jgi:hypothetical protein
MPSLNRDARLAAFITASTAAHAGRYRYDKVAKKVVNAPTKVVIICPDHGDFEMTPNAHKRGQRCPDCSKRRGSRTDIRKAWSLDRARTMHGEKNGYDDVDYLDQHTPVTITCRLHGSFTQRTTNHLDTSTPRHCPDCADITRIVSLKAAAATRTRTSHDRDTGRYRSAACTGNVSGNNPLQPFPSQRPSRGGHPWANP